MLNQFVMNQPSLINMVLSMKLTSLMLAKIQLQESNKPKNYYKMVQLVSVLLSQNHYHSTNQVSIMIQLVVMVLMLN